MYATSNWIINLSSIQIISGAIQISLIVALLNKNHTVFFFNYYFCIVGFTEAFTYNCNLTCGPICGPPVAALKRLPRWWTSTDDLACVFKNSYCNPLAWSSLHSMTFFNDQKMKFSTSPGNLSLYYSKHGTESTCLISRLFCCCTVWRVA